jgi:excinuclease ABC subunit A
VIVIEHNMDIIKQADHIIDLGPEGGRHGGEVQCAGTPEALAAADTHTSAYLREELERTRAAEDGGGEIAPVGANGSEADPEVAA